MKARNVLFILAVAVIIAVVAIYAMRQPPTPAPAPGPFTTRTPTPAPAPAPVTVTSELIDRDVERHNRAVGLMGRYEYAEAREIFAELADRHSANPDLRVNLAIATLNRQRTGDEQGALSVLADVLEDHPEHLRARYCAGLLKLYLGEPGAAREHFRFVAERDPDDAHAAYYVAQTLMQARSYEEALEWYDRAIELHPYLRSAYYGRSQVLYRLNREAEAQEAFSEFDRLKTNPRSTSVEFVYTKMGPKAETIALGEPDQPPAPPQGPVFLGPQPLLAGASNAEWRVRRGDRPVSLTACDLTGDNAVDLFLAGALDAREAVNAVCVNDGSGGFTLVVDHPLADIPEVNAALWGDYDNDGLVDVYLCRRGPNMLWRQRADGRWENVTESTGTANASFDTVDGLFVDADHDGDLDLFCVNADGPNELLNNNRDGTFTPIAEDRGIAGSGRPSRQALAVDFDTDRDLDLVVINEAPPHEVYLNDRMWRYRAMDESGDYGAMIAANIVAAVAGDVDADGQTDVFTLDRNGTSLRWQPDAADAWRSQPVATLTRATAEDIASTGQIALTDVTGDGAPELIVGAASGWTAVPLGNDGAAGAVHVADVPSLAGWGLFIADAARGPAIVGLSRDDDASPVIWPAGPGRHEYAALRFTGREDAGQSLRSNASGIGTRFMARIDARWAAGRTLPNHSGPGQSLQPVPIGLGGEPQIDFVSIDWSDGIFQSELDLATGETHTIAETQRQLSSCPVLFAWDGGKYEFVSDVLGVGGIGYALAPGEYAEPRPWERFIFPHGLLQPKDGRYHIKLGEPMEEACYLDAARLVAYDVPPGWSMTVDDRFAIGGPAPTGEPRFYRDSMEPKRATNDRGVDVTGAVRAADHLAAPIGPLDRRFIGRLAGEHVLTMEFPRAIAEGPGAPVLIIDGWVEYPYSQTMFAAWQADAAYHAPTLEARDGAGRWHVVMEQFGYPAGMPREMSVPLDGLPPGADALRLHTNQEIYFDRFRVAWVEDCPAAVRRPLELKAAALIRAGFARRIEQPQRRPYYDYQDRRPFWDTRHQAGYYTVFGPVEGLLRDRDGALAIFGPGEEVHIEFAAPPPIADGGWRRYQVLEVEGWCKDLDLFTRNGETIAPLPSRPDDTRAESLVRRLNTRFEAGQRP